MTRLNGDIGGRLRHARQQRGMSLHEAARATKLSIHVLRAIERNDFEILPEGIYRKGYLRSLAREVGLDPQEIAAEYDKEFDPVTNPAAVADRHVLTEDKWAMQLTPSPRGSIVTLVILIALAIGWFAWPDGIEPPLPAATLAGELIPARPRLDTAAPIRRASALAEGTMTSSRIDVPLRIELAATDWCWVAAESDGKRALYRLVEPGERVVIEGHRLISLRLGNAGSVTLSINDGPRRLAGGDSEVVDVKLTPDNVEALRDGAVEIVSGD
jgi:transcriptional regulator with XRE-family HTH domain